MPAAIGSCVDLPNVAAAADGEIISSVYAPFLRGRLIFCGWFCPGTVAAYLLPFPTPLFSRTAVVGAIGSATACQS
ncbi:MAG: hypothetical protein ACLSU6_15750 [Thomasclavelia ramosa]